MALFQQLISGIIILSWPCILLLLYTRFSKPTRFILQTLFIFPILIFCSIICSLIAFIIKFLTFEFISGAYRQSLLGLIANSFNSMVLFFFEFWPNNHYVVSDEGIGDDVFYLNNILICNHSASPFDWLVVSSFGDYLGRFHNTFTLAKKEMAYVPIIGWVGGLTTAILLNRNWDKDKKMIENLCNEFKKGKKGKFKYTTPWCFAFYPEGTRFTQKKWLKAKEFAQQRGLTVYENLLQPRVKGFSYFAHHLHDILGCMIDVTCVYHPKPPSARNLLLNTRTARYTHLHLKVYREEDIPKDIEDLNQWIRDRWTEKDKRVQEMKDKKLNIKY